MTKKERNCSYGNITWQWSKNKHTKATFYSSEIILYTSFSKNKSLPSATSVLSPQPKPMAYNTTTSMDKLTCTDYVHFGKSQDLFGRLSWSKNDSNYLDVKLKVFKKHDNNNFRLVQNLTMGESDFNQFMRLRNQLVIAAENFHGKQSLSPIQIPTPSENMDEQLKLSHRVVDVVESRLTHTSSISSCTVTETIRNSKKMKLIRNWQNTSQFDFWFVFQILA